jgi:exodeoxyribonuclease VII small subunit
VSNKPAGKPADKPAAPNFEQSLAELEKLVEKMEAGDQSLEEALTSFQRGIELARICHKGLKEAEQKVEQLVQKDGADTLEPFESADAPSMARGPRLDPIGESADGE